MATIENAPAGENTSPARTLKLALSDDYYAQIANLLKNYVESPAQGMVFYYNGTNWVGLAPGTSGQFLKTLGAGANPAWDTVTDDIQALLDEIGTTEGDLLLRGSSDWQRLAAGLEGQILQLSSGTPNWEDADARWISESLTWTYVAANQFSLPGGAALTTVYSKGTRLKWTQTTERFGVVLSSSHSAGTVTVTIAVNSDYVIDNAAITSPAYSHTLAPENYPHFFNYTPTVVGFSSDPTFICRYSITGSLMRFSYAQAAAATSDDTAFTVSIPVTAKNVSNYFQYSSIPFVFNNGAQEANGLVWASPNSATLTLRRSASATWTASGNKNAGFTIDVEF